MAHRPVPRDPLGKRALFWLPVEDPDDEAPPVRRWFAPAEATPDSPGSAGKRALYSVDSVAGSESGGGNSPPSTTEDGRRIPPRTRPAGGRGSFAVVCSSCSRTTRVGPLELAALHAPVCAFVPFRRFDHWMCCPACRRRTWTGVTLAR